jgi:hypothetical protein
MSDAARQSVSRRRESSAMSSTRPRHSGAKSPPGTPTRAAAPRNRPGVEPGPVRAQTPSTKNTQLEMKIEKSPGHGPRGLSGRLGGAGKPCPLLQWPSTLYPAGYLLCRLQFRI